MPKFSKYKVTLVLRCLKVFLNQIICISFSIGDHINLVSSSMPSFPILQRSSEEKILYSDRLTLER